jgi:hypothetical protein
MPKVVIYIRAADARAIEAREEKEIEAWVRGLVARAVEAWKEKQR